MPNRVNLLKVGVIIKKKSCKGIILQKTDSRVNVGTLEVQRWCKNVDAGV